MPTAADGFWANVEPILRQLHARQQAQQSGDPVLALCLILDEEEGDWAMGPLADWLEEQGDRRGKGLRLIGDRRPNLLSPACWYWYGHDDPTILARDKHAVPMDVRMRLSDWPSSHTPGWPTRSAAILALAQALSESV